jgi:bacterioferritin (cytochrome b1)
VQHLLEQVAAGEREHRPPVVRVDVDVKRTRGCRVNDRTVGGRDVGDGVDDGQKIAPMPDKEPMDVDGCIDALNRVLPLQYRSALAYTYLAGTTRGWSYQGLVPVLRDFAAAELDSARHLVEKVTTLGGTPTAEVAEISQDDDPEQALNWLIDAETRCIELLQDVIPHTGTEGRSEALEHRLEHTIMRKQEQVDLLIRARGTRGEPG